MHAESSSREIKRGVTGALRDYLPHDDYRPALGQLEHQGRQGLEPAGVPAIERVGPAGAGRRSKG